VVAVFIGATDGSTSISRVLQATLSALPSPSGAPASASVAAAADDLQSLQGMLAERLSALCGGESGSSRRRVCLVFDAVNELDATNGARALRWLPRRLPLGCSVLLSTIGCAPAGSEEASAAAVQDVRLALMQRWGLDPSADVAVAKGGTQGAAAAAAAPTMNSEVGQLPGRHLLRLTELDAEQRSSLLRQMVHELGGGAALLTDEDCAAALVSAPFPSIYVGCVD
jgi:hypothetical protein